MRILAALALLLPAIASAQPSVSIPSDWSWVNDGTGCADRLNTGGKGFDLVVPRGPNFPGENVQYNGCRSSFGGTQTTLDGLNCNNTGEIGGGNCTTCSVIAYGTDVGNRTGTGGDFYQLSAGAKIKDLLLKASPTGGGIRNMLHQQPPSCETNPQTCQHPDLFQAFQDGNLPNGQGGSVGFEGGSVVIQGYNDGTTDNPYEIVNINGHQAINAGGFGSRWGCSACGCGGGANDGPREFVLHNVRTGNLDTATYQVTKNQLGNNGAFRLPYLYMVDVELYNATYRLRDKVEKIVVVGGFAKTGQINDPTTDGTLVSTNGWPGPLRQGDAHDVLTAGNCPADYDTGLSAWNKPNPGQCCPNGLVNPGNSPDFNTGAGLGDDPIEVYCYDSIDRMIQDHPLFQHACEDQSGWTAAGHTATCGAGSVPDLVFPSIAVAQVNTGAQYTVTWTTSGQDAVGTNYRVKCGANPFSALQAHPDQNFDCTAGGSPGTEVAVVEWQVPGCTPEVDCPTNQDTVEVIANEFAGSMVCNPNKAPPTVPATADCTVTTVNGDEPITCLADWDGDLVYGGPGEPAVAVVAGVGTFTTPEFTTEGVKTIGVQCDDATPDTITATDTVAFDPPFGGGGVVDVLTDEETEPGVFVGHATALLVADLPASGFRIEDSDVVNGCLGLQYNKGTGEVGWRVVHTAPDGTVTVVEESSEPLAFPGDDNGAIRCSPELNQIGTHQLESTACSLAWNDGVCNGQQAATQSFNFERGDPPPPAPPSAPEIPTGPRVMGR